MLDDDGALALEASGEEDDDAGGDDGAAAAPLAAIERIRSAIAAENAADSSTLSFDARAAVAVAEEIVGEFVSHSLVRW